MADSDSITKQVPVENLDEAIAHFTNNQGYRLEMIKPADAPREALLLKNGRRIRLILSEPPVVTGELNDGQKDPPDNSGGSDWVIGRAGMEYRDLIPGRLGGKVIASHIRLTKGGEVPDYVHYHKVDFQIIYCKRGRIKVVYEDQGPPFWLETGDCVLQPPEIRHRVLECTAGAEVIEISMPADHETWVEHNIELPTAELKRDRDFSGQRFCKSDAFRRSVLMLEGVTVMRRDLGIGAATGGRYNALVQQLRVDEDLPANYANERDLRLYFKLDAAEMLVVELGLSP